MFFGMNIGKSIEIQYENCIDPYDNQIVPCLKFFRYFNVGPIKFQYHSSYIPIAPGEEAIKALEEEQGKLCHLEQNMTLPPKSAVEDACAIAVAYETLFQGNANITTEAKMLLIHAKAHCPSQERFKEIRENTINAVTGFQGRRENNLFGTYSLIINNK